MKALETVLSNPKFIRVQLNRRSTRDQRNRVDQHLYEYTGSDNEQYRKAFEVKPGKTPLVPSLGTHKTINDLQYQL